MPDQDSIPPLHVSPSMALLEWGYLFLLSALWGASFFFVEVALRDVPVFTIVFLRLFLGSLGLLAVMIVTGGTLFWNGRILSACFVMGFFKNALPFVLLVWGQTNLDSGVAAIFLATTPLFTAFLVHFLTIDERLTPTRVAGILIGFLGVVTVTGADFREGWNASLLASCACLGAALSIGIAIYYARWFLKTGVPVLSAATGQLLAGSVLLLPLVIFIDNPWNQPVPQTSSWAALTALGLLSTSLAYILFYRILSTAGAMNLSLVTLLVPVCAVLLGIGLLGEHIKTHQLSGMALIGMGLIVIDGKLWRQFTGTGHK